MLLKKNITSMSDLSDYSPKSLCRVSETNESIESDFSLINPQLEMMKSSELESVQMDSRNRRSELKRVKDFLNQHKDMMPWIRDLIVTSGVKKLYDDKYRELMFEYGTSKHPHPEERL